MLSFSIRFKKGHKAFENFLIYGKESLRFRYYILFLCKVMSLETRLHKKMVKIIFSGVADLEESQQQKDMEAAVRSSVEASRKPRMRGIKEFFRLGIEEFKRDIKKTIPKNKSNKE